MRVMSHSELNLEKFQNLIGKMDVKLNLNRIKIALQFKWIHVTIDSETLDDIKRIVYPKMKILSLIIHPNVFPIP